MDPLPNVNKAYYMIAWVETKRNVIRGYSRGPSEIAQLGTALLTIHLMMKSLILMPWLSKLISIEETRRIIEGLKVIGAVIIAKG